MISHAPSIILRMGGLGFVMSLPVINGTQLLITWQELNHMAMLGANPMSPGLISLQLQCQTMISSSLPQVIAFIGSLQTRMM